MRESESPRFRVPPYSCQRSPIAEGGGQLLTVPVTPGRPFHPRVHDPFPPRTWGRPWKRGRWEREGERRPGGGTEGAVSGKKGVLVALTLGSNLGRVEVRAGVGT